MAYNQWINLRIVSSDVKATYMQIRVFVKYIKTAEDIAREKEEKIR